MTHLIATDSWTYCEMPLPQSEPGKTQSTVSPDDRLVRQWQLATCTDCLQGLVGHIEVYAEGIENYRR